MTNEEKTDRLVLLMQLAAAECTSALRELERALFSANFYATRSWERRLQKVSLRAMRAEARLSALELAVEAHHEATCEKCALDRVVDREMMRIVEEHEEFGNVPMEERN